MDYYNFILFYINFNFKNQIMINKKLVILGSGETGIGSAILAKKMGYDILLSDHKEIDLGTQKILQDHKILYGLENDLLPQILAADEVLKSPGIPEKNELVKKIRKQNIRIISEIEFAYRHKGNSKIVAITGSNGKSTTTALIYHICKTAGIDCAMVGNIGISIAKQIATDPKEWYITEVSSFQLDDIQTFKPEIAILLNITEDHLDRYDYNFQNYIDSKFKITQNLTINECFIYNVDDDITQKNMFKISNKINLIPISMKEKLNNGVYITQDKMIMKLRDEKVIIDINDFALKGIHNSYNTMAASVATMFMGIKKPKIREAINNFKGLPHRMEKLPTIKHIHFINDSKATNINSTWYALESVESPTILILGGIDKGNDYSIISDLVKEKVKAIICLGLDNKKIIEHFKNIAPIILEFDDMKKAVQTSFSLAHKDDCVLLSPACASFDLFKNYEDRGNQFREAVKNL